MSNSFERYAETMAMTRKSRLRVVHSEKAAPMVPTPLEKEQREQRLQFTRFQKAKRAEHKALLMSGHAKEYKMLLGVLKTLTPQSSGELLRHIKHAKWIRFLDEQQRMTVLSIIDAKITRLRILGGLAPFDDPMPGSPPNLFLLVRKEITGV